MQTEYGLVETKIYKYKLLIEISKQTSAKTENYNLLKRKLEGYPKKSLDRGCSALRLLRPLYIKFQVVELVGRPTMLRQVTYFGEMLTKVMLTIVTFFERHGQKIQHLHASIHEIGV